MYARPTKSIGQVMNALPVITHDISILKSASVFSVPIIKSMMSRSRNVSIVPLKYHYLMERNVYHVIKDSSITTTLVYVSPAHWVESIMRH